MGKRIRLLCWVETKTEEDMQDFIGKTNVINDIDAALIKVFPIQKDAYADVISVRQYIGDSFTQAENAPDGTVFHFGRLP